MALIKGVLERIVDIEGIEINGNLQTDVTKICACFLAKDTSISDVLSWIVARIDSMNVLGKLSMVNSSEAFSKLDVNTSFLREWGGRL